MKHDFGTNKDKKIGIFALGLIGGSLYKALIKKGYNVVPCSRSVDFAHNDINVLKDCDVVFVCTPMNKTIEVLDMLENVVSSDCIVLDVCSLKSFVMQKKRPYKFIGSHPMAGTENSGFAASFEELFEGSVWVLTQSNDIIEKIISDIGARLVIADAQEHDYAVALISHLPMLLSQALFDTTNNNKLAQNLAASGFRDMTRLAMTNPELASDMMKMNKININEALNKLYNSIKCLKTDNYDEKIKRIAQERKKMYDADGKNNTEI